MFNIWFVFSIYFNAKHLMIVVPLTFLFFVSHVGRFSDWKCIFFLIFNVCFFLLLTCLPWVWFLKLISGSTEEKEKKKDAEKEPEMSQNAQFRAIRPSPSILTFVEKNVILYEDFLLTYLIMLMHHFLEGILISCTLIIIHSC